MNNTYIISKGDYLYNVAKAHGLTLGELLAANPQFTQKRRNPNLIFPGETINIPRSKFTNDINLNTGTTSCPEDTYVKPQLVDDGAEYISNSDAYKNCAKSVKDQIKSKKFTDDEKKEINEVTEKYKPLLKCKNHPLKKVGRTDKAITKKNGTCVTESDTMGEWFENQGSVVLTDSASVGTDFKDSTKQFRGTVAHEFSHALMNNFDPRNCKKYTNELKNPLMQEYQKIAGWDKTGTTLTETKEDKAPTKYGKTNPKEDLAEATMLYLYELETLKTRSPKRYEFVKKLFDTK